MGIVDSNKNIFEKMKLENTFSGPVINLCNQSEQFEQLS